MKQTLEQYWQAVAKQDAAAIEPFFAPSAIIRWQDSNEQFTVDEFIIANCEYPDSWAGVIVRFDQHDDNHITTVTKITNTLNNMAFFVVSFFQLEGGKIMTLDEYWSEIGEAPTWRQALKLGKAIRV